MKSVLRSAKPYWIYLIITGKKKIEVGKDFPKSTDWGKTVEMYCSKDKKSFKRIPEKDREWMRKYLGKVACRFVCDRIEQFNVGSLACDDIEKLACLTYREMIDYFYRPEELDGKTVKVGYAWHISDLKIYGNPKELGEFRQCCPDKIFANSYDCSNGYKQCKYFSENEGFFECNAALSRPPQSWCYIEEL